MPDETRVSLLELLAVSCVVAACSGSSSAAPKDLLRQERIELPLPTHSVCPAHRRSSRARLSGAFTRTRRRHPGVGDRAVTDARSQMPRADPATNPGQGCRGQRESGAGRPARGCGMRDRGRWFSQAALGFGLACWLQRSFSMLLPSRDSISEPHEALEASSVGNGGGRVSRGDHDGHPGLQQQPRGGSRRGKRRCRRPSRRQVRRRRRRRRRGRRGGWVSEPGIELRVRGRRRRCRYLCGRPIVLRDLQQLRWQFREWAQYRPGSVVPRHCRRVALCDRSGLRLRLPSRWWLHLWHSLQLPRGERFRHAVLPADLTRARATARGRPQARPCSSPMPPIGGSL